MAPCSLSPRGNKRSQIIYLLTINSVVSLLSSKSKKSEYMLLILSVDEIRTSEVCLKNHAWVALTWRMVDKTRHGIASVWFEYLNWSDYDCRMINDEIEGVQTNHKIQVEVYAAGGFWDGWQLETYTFDPVASRQLTIVCGVLGNIYSC